jgi:perosamine synthetase
LGTFGITGCFSFSPNKIITTGQGGVIVTDDNEIHHRLRELKDQGRPVKGTGGDDIHYSRGYNFKFTNLQAALGLGQLSYLDERMERLKRTHEVYAENLQGIDAIQVLPFKVHEGELPLWTDVLVENRDDFVDYLQAKNIGCRKFWHPLHTQEPYKSSKDTFPVATELAPKALWLPSAFTLDDEDIVYISNMIRQLF